MPISKSKALFSRRVGASPLVGALLVLAGCGGSIRQPVAQSGRSTPVYAQRQLNPKLMLFGGQDHKTYLGCLNCSQYATDSVSNEYGVYGSPYSAESIWNHFSEFGSGYSNFGACNAYATDPPVIVDGAGTFYGRLTLNQYHPEKGIAPNYYEWLADRVCK